jgi:hypothetical protein
LLLIFALFDLLWVEILATWQHWVVQAHLMLGTTFAALTAGDQVEFLSLAYQLMERLAALTHTQHSLPDR